jgi:3-phenylpropionate/cinnamic acid dioxygenase small subunit
MPPLAAEAMVVNLLHRYAELVDDGDFVGVSALFHRAQVYMSGPSDNAVAGDAVGSIMQRFVRLYEGVPLTRHVITNTIVEMANDGLTATTRSYFTVIQIVAAPQIIVIGRYHDRFAIDHKTGEWHFTERIIMVDAAGDVSGHLTQSLPTNGDRPR